MNIVETCRLCCNATSLAHHLFGEFGECTEIYDITVKYFDPMLLALDNVDSLKLSKRICHECWNHIHDFHEFQQTIILAQYKLIDDDVKPSLLEEAKDMDEISLDHTDNEFQEEYVYIPKDNETSLDSIVYKNGSTKKDKHNDDAMDCAENLPRIKKFAENQMKQNSMRQKRGRKSKIKNIDPTKSISYNSAEKLQELDAFIANIKPELECDMCKLNFPNYDSLRLHFTKEHQTKCYVVCCNKKIVRRYLLVEHLRLHVNPETYKCDICGSNSNSSRSLVVHKRFMHDAAIKTHECEICRRKFKNKTILVRHKATHATEKKDFKCNECGRCYAFEFQMKIHVSKVHNEKLVCDHCGKMMNGSSALKQHILIQHSDIKVDKWRCGICNTQLSSHKSLKSHRLSFHNDGTTAFICKVCGKVAASENALMRHKKFVHEMERKFKCTFCEKAFKKNTNLKEHIATHTGQHLYQCPHCTQTFNNNANMHKHRKRAHPVEWAKSRQNRMTVPKVKPDSIIKEIVL